MSKEFRKYLTPYSPVLIFFTIMSVFFIILGLFAEVIAVSVIFAACALVFLSSLFKGKKFFKQLESDPQLSAMAENDFHNAKSMARDTVRFGELWIYTKHSGHLLAYHDIAQVYQTIRRYMFFEIKRYVTCVTVGKKRETFSLCTLKRRGKSDAELQEIVALLHSKNPNIKFGFK